MATIDPFANESEALQVDELTIENRTDRVSIYGSIDITRDRRGQEMARRFLVQASEGRLYVVKFICPPRLIAPGWRSAPTSA